MNTWVNLIYSPRSFRSRTEISFILYYPPESVTCKFRAAQGYQVWLHECLRKGEPNCKEKDKNNADTLRKAEVKAHTKKRWRWGMKRESENRRDWKRQSETEIHRKLTPGNPDNLLVLVSSRCNYNCCLHVLWDNSAFFQQILFIFKLTWSGSLIPKEGLQYLLLIKHIFNNIHIIYNLQTYLNPMYVEI